MKVATLVSVTMLLFAWSFADPDAVLAKERHTTYRSFSYAPQNISKGDSVVVVGKNTQLMRGKEVLATVAEGQKLQVLQVRGPWIGVAVDVDGNKTGGWISQSNLALEKAVETASRAPSQRYRSFSYQPSGRATVAARPRRSVDRRKPAFLRPAFKARGDYGRGDR